MENDTRPRQPLTAAERRQVPTSLHVRWGGVRRLAAVATLLLLAVAVSQAMPAEAQTPAASPGIDAITPAALGRYSATLAADSLRISVLPSPPLERAARYVADQFHRLGLVPGGDSGTWIQRYPVPRQRRLDEATSQLVFLSSLYRRGKSVVDERDNDVWWRFDASLAGTARWIPALREVLPVRVEDPLVIAGHQTVATIRRMSLGGHLVLYFPPPGEDSLVRQQVFDELRTATRWVVLADPQDSAGFAAARRQAPQEPVSVVEPYLAVPTQRHGGGWAIAVRDSVVARFAEAAGIDVARARATAEPLGATSPDAAVYLDAKPVMDDRAVPTIPNVVGILEGADPALKDQCVVVTARLDGPADGTTLAGLLLLAQAFREAKTPLRRSVLFLAASEGDLQWGSHFFTYGRTPVPTPVVQLAIDLGGTAGDSVPLAGAADIAVARPVGLLAVAHPELGLTVVDGGTAFRPGVEAFASEGIPSLVLGGGAAGEPSGQGRRAAAAAVRAARILRLAYYLGEALGNADDQPRWSPMGRRHLFERSMSDTSAP